MKKVRTTIILVAFLLVALCGCSLDGKHTYADFDVGEHMYSSWDSCIIKLPNNYLLFVLRDYCCYLFKVSPEYYDTYVSNWSEVLGDSYIYEYRCLDGTCTDDAVIFHTINNQAHDRYFVINLYSFNTYEYDGYVDFINHVNVTELNWFDINQNDFEEFKCRLVAKGQQDNLELVLKAIQGRNDIIRQDPTYSFYDDGNTLYMEFTMEWPTNDRILNHLWLTDISKEYQVSFKILEYYWIHKDKVYMEIEDGEVRNVIRETVSWFYNLKKDTLIPIEYTTGNH